MVKQIIFKYLFEEVKISQILQAVYSIMKLTVVYCMAQFFWWDKIIDGRTSLRGNIDGQHLRSPY